MKAAADEAKTAETEDEPGALAALTETKVLSSSCVSASAL